MIERSFVHIFYPETIEPARKADPPRKLPAAILVPDAAYDWVKEEIRTPYERMSTSNPNQVLVLSPLHQEVRKESGSALAFIPEGTRFGSLPLVSIDDLPHWMGRDDAYFQEEPAPEAQGAVIEAFFPGVRILPLLVKPDLSSKECQELAAFLERMLDKESRTLVVACLNGNALATGRTANKDFTTLVSLLKQDKPLLEALHSHQISSLGTMILEAIGRTRQLQGPWKLTACSLREHHYETIPEILPEEEGRYTWHLSGHKGNET